METQRTQNRATAAPGFGSLAARIAFVYLLFGVLWILCSDRLLDALVQDGAQAMQWQTLKGWLFVAVSTTLLYVLLARAERKRQHTQQALEESEHFARSTLDGLSAHVAIVDAEGTILAVNQAWRNFAVSNPPVGTNVCEGANYLAVCAVPTGSAGGEAATFSNAIRAVIAGETDAVAIEYPCHSPTEQRWFVGRITRFPGPGPARAVIAHENVTPQKVMEHAIRLQAAALQAAANGIAITDRDGTIQWVNPAFAELTGYSAEESIGRNPRELLRSGLHDARFYRNLWGTILAGKVWRGEMINRRRDGTLYNEDQTITPVVNDAGEVTHFVAIKQDITQRKQAEAALRRNEASLAMAQTIAKMGSWEEDLVTGARVWSTGMMQLFGLAPDDPAPTHAEFVQMLHPDDRTIPDEVTQRICATGRGAEVELRTEPSMGPVRYLSCTLDPLLDGDGQVVKLVGTMLDATEHRQVEAEHERLLQRVQTQADQMTQIMRCVPEGVVLLDRDGHVLMANPQAIGDLSLLAAVGPGAPLKQLGGRPLSDFFTSPPAGKWHVLSWASRVFEVIARPVEESRMLSGWVLVLRDVTEERVVQEQLQRQERLAAIGQLAAGIAHDFNNIMSVISIYAELTAQAVGLAERERARLVTIGQQASRATRMIRQILDFSRRSVLERQTMDLLPLMQEQQRLLEQTLPENIAIRLDYEPGEYIVKGDPTRIQQLVMNLAVNARDAMLDGGVLAFELAHLEVSSEVEAPVPTMHPGSWVRIAVKDTGAGMTTEVQKHIFEPFFTTKAPGQGTGLGLAQVHGIVAQHDGHITVNSRAGRGTTFTIYLPALVVVVPGDATIYAMAAKHQGNGERLLVVEDDEDLRTTLVELLAMWNYCVTEATDGEHALALLAEARDQIDLIISDIVMPRLGGIALVKTLHRRASNTPVILLTGHAMGQEMEGLAALGLSTWLTKPPSAEQLASAITAALHKSKSNGRG